MDSNIVDCQRYTRQHLLVSLWRTQKMETRSKFKTFPTHPPKKNNITEFKTYSKDNDILFGKHVFIWFWIYSTTQCHSQRRMRHWSNVSILLEIFKYRPIHHLKKYLICLRCQFLLFWPETKLVSRVTDWFGMASLGTGNSRKIQDNPEKKISEC